MQTEIAPISSVPRSVRVQTDDGVSLAVLVAGDGPGLLLVHGHGGCKEDFADHLAKLAERYTVVMPDLRGHGESDKPANADMYSFDRIQRDLLQVADTLGFDTFTILGHSMGGMVVRGLVLDTPERIDALILMDTCAGPIDGFDPELMDLAASVAFNDGKAALKALLDMASPLDNPAYQRSLAERPGYQDFVDSKWNALSEVMWGSMVRAIAHQADDSDRMRAITAPTLVIVGELDLPFREASERMTDAIDGSELVVISGAGHSPQFENPSEWIAAVDAFLMRARAEATANS